MVIGLEKYFTVVVCLFIVCGQVYAEQSGYMKLLYDPTDLAYDSEDHLQRPSVYIGESKSPIFSRATRQLQFDRSERAPNSADEKYQIRHVGDLPMFRFG